MIHLRALAAVVVVSCQPPPGNPGGGPDGGQSGGGSGGQSGGGTGGQGGGGGGGGGSPVAPLAFSDRYSVWDRIPGACSVAGGHIEGREPSSAGRYPVFVYLVGTGDNYKSELALLEITRMAEKGFVAASLDYGQDIVSTIYDVDYVNHGFDQPKLLDGKTRCAFGAGQESAISKLCARAKADCSRGIVTSGHSQGSMVAALAKNHDWRVNASVGYGTGYSSGIDVGFIRLAFDVASLMLNGARALPNDRFRVVNGQSEHVIGGWLDAGVYVPGPAPQQQMKEVTGMDCGSALGACFRPNGSGYYHLADSEPTAGVAGHCFMGNSDAGDCSAGPLDLKFTDGSAAWALPAHLAWLDGFTISHAGLDEGLVANWRLDSSSGATAADSDDLAHNAGAVTSATWVAGVKGNALELTGGATRVDVASDPSLTVAESLSISLWVKPQAGSSGARMLVTHAAGTDGAYYVALTGSGAIEFKYGPWWYATYSSTPKVSDGVWTHVVAVYDRANAAVAISLDGAVEMRPSRGAPLPAAGTTRLGQDSTGGRAFSGALDEVRIYNRALSASEIGALYHGGAPIE